MERRKQKRYESGHDAKINGRTGVIDNLSLQGVQVSTALLPQKRDIAISFEVYGEVLNLYGMIQWIRRKGEQNSHNRMGVYIENPPIQYCTFVSTLREA